MTKSSWRIPLAVLSATFTFAKVSLAQTVQPAVPATGIPGTVSVAPGGTVSSAVPASTPLPGTVTTPVPVEATVDDGWGGCIDPNDPTALVKIGKKTTICLTLSSSTEWNIPPPSTRTLRLSFQPLADEYSRFHVPSSYQDLVVTQSTGVFDGTNNVTIHAASQQVVSFQRLFYSPNAGAGRVFPYLTAIIDVSKGVVKGITWDDACIFCSKDECVENTYDFDGNLGTQKDFKQPTKACYVPQTECTASLANGQPRCDITLYVVWTGDDADGKALRSSAFRFSMFPEQELQNRLANNLPELPSFLGGGSTTPDAEATTDQGAS